ncbi:MAG TPA: DUF2207 domain-containing protein [Sphingomicrobium sp.]
MRTVRRAVPALLLLLATPAYAEERILRFLSDVQVEKDSSLEVTETIDVRAEHIDINHGIFRDFPTRYKGPHGSQVRVGFTFQGAILDGMPVPASVGTLSNGVRIKVGDPDKLVDIGEHRYVLRYRATRQIGRFPNYDELYWNATGNGWMFPIDVAEARIRLPQAVRLGQRAAYTGPQGSTASNAEVIDEKPGEISFRTTQPLGAYEGLTVAVAFPKGVVEAANSTSRFMDWLADRGPPAVGVLALLGLLGFYYVAWQRAGRNPRAGTVVPIFEPPVDLTPAGMRYVLKMGPDNRGFAAALVDMGIRGHVRLVEEERGLLWGKQMRLERLPGINPLPREEEAALDQLCSAGESILMKQENHAKFSSAKNALAQVLKTGYEGRLFNRNLGWAALGVLLFFVAIWLAAAAVVAATNGTESWLVVATLGSVLVAVLVSAARRGSKAVGKCLLSVVAFVAVLIAFATGMPIFGEAIASGWWLPLVIPALALPIVISSFWWIAAPTKAGRVVLDRIAGFKQYLSITERERLDRMTPLEDTPELFEKYLPYAIALHVENHWAERFAGVLAAAAAQGQTGFAWYSGSNSPWDNPTGFAHSVGSSLSETVSSASTAPGSSGGSGGGGSSGGGGGGGGGGGW